MTGSHFVSSQWDHRGEDVLAVQITLFAVANEARACADQDEPGVRAFLLAEAVGYPAKVSDVERNKHAVLGRRQFQQLVIGGALQFDLAIHGARIVAVVSKSPAYGAAGDVGV